MANEFFHSFALQGRGFCFNLAQLDEQTKKTPSLKTGSVGQPPVALIIAREYSADEVIEVGDGSVAGF